MAVDSVLKFEAKLSNEYAESSKYEFSKRGQQIQKQYSKTYALAYSKALNNMIEKRMRSTILAVGSFWYSA